MRVSPPRISGIAAAVPRPPLGSPGADAHRQAGFVLGAEVEAVVDGLNLEFRAAEASAGAKFRKQPVAAAMMAWSRAWLCRMEALHAAQGGNYAAALPLVRAGADFMAAEFAMLESDAAEWQEWLDAGGVGAAHDVHATEYRLHAFRSAETLARHETLGRVYRESSDLSMPHFGATLLVAGHDSGPERIVATFGDRDFHLGLAELVLGWLLELGREQVRMLESGTHLAPPGEEGARGWLGAAEGALVRADRCRIEAIERDGERRLLVQNWRARPGDAAKRILL